MTRPEPAGVPSLSNDEWKAAFIARMVERWNIWITLDFRWISGQHRLDYLLTETSARQYATQAADTYLPDRGEYKTPQTAADTDWGDGND